jgi:hypothetical protein
MVKYNCSLRGTCEADPYGPFSSQDECSLNCTAVTRRDEVELIFQYNLTDASGLAPSDRVRIIYSLTRVSVDTNDSHAILLALDQQDMEPLLPYPSLVDYVMPKWSPGVIRDSLVVIGSLKALEVLERLPYGKVEIKKLAKSAIKKGNDDVIEALFEQGYYEVLLSLWETLLDNGSEEVVTVYLDYVEDEVMEFVPQAVRGDNEVFLGVLVGRGLIGWEEVEEMREEYREW